MTSSNKTNAGVETIKISISKFGDIYVIYMLMYLTHLVCLMYLMILLWYIEWYAWWYLMIFVDSWYI